MGEKLVPTKPNPKGKAHTARQKVARDDNLVHARLGGTTWKELASEFRLTEKACRIIYAQWQEQNKEVFLSADPVGFLIEVLERLDKLYTQQAKIAKEADQPMVRIAAGREMANLLERQVRMRQEAGLMPRNLGELRVQIDVRWVSAQLIAVLERHDVSPEVAQELVEVLSGAGMS